MGAVVPLLREEVAPKRQTPVRKPNAELRTREHLTEREVEKLIEAAKGNRYGHRDATMILVAYRHGLRASELVDLQVGPRCTSPAPTCTSGDGKTAAPLPIPSPGWNYAPCAA